MRQSTALLTSALLFGCTDATVVERDLGPPIQTDRLLYDIVSDKSAWRTEIVWTFTNPIDETVYVVNCRGATPQKLEKWDSGEWVYAWSPIMNLCLSPSERVGRR